MSRCKCGCGRPFGSKLTRKRIKRQMGYKVVYRVLCCVRLVSHKLARALFIKPIGLQRPREPGLLPHVDRHRWLQHRKKIVE